MCWKASLLRNKRLSSNRANQIVPCLFLATVSGLSRGGRQDGGYLWSGAPAIVELIMCWHSYCDSKKTCKQSNAPRHNCSVNPFRCPTLSFLNVTAPGDTVLHKYCTSVEPGTSRQSSHLQDHISTPKHVLSCHTLLTVCPGCLVKGELAGLTTTHTFKAVLGDGGVLTQDITSRTMSAPAYEPMCVCVCVRAGW